MPLTALDELRKAAEERNDDRYIALADIVDAHQDYGVRKQKNIYLQTLLQNKYCQNSPIRQELRVSGGEERLWTQWKCAEMRLQNW